MTHKKTSSAVVIGGGIFGTSTAVQLLRRGVSVTLINDGPLANGASGRSLSWLNSSRMRSEPYHRLRMAGMDRYRTLSDRFPDVDWLSFKGGLTWDGDDENNQIDEAYNHEVKLAYEALHLNASDVATVTPGVDGSVVTPQGAIFNPSEGWVDLPLLIKVLLDEFTQLGGALVTDAGAAIVKIENGRAVGALTANGSKFNADAVLVATGPSVPQMAADAGQKIDDGSPIAVLLTTKPVQLPLQAVLNTPRIAIRPGPNNSFSLDADWAEEDVRDLGDGSYDVKQETLDALLAEASNVLEGNPKLELGSYGIGRKPIPGDGEPVLGEISAIPGYFVAFSHSGATLGLIVGELLAYEISTGKHHPLLATFRPDRFA